MAINKYQGNSGRVQRIAEQTDAPAPQAHGRNRPAPPVQSTRPLDTSHKEERGGLELTEKLSGGLEKTISGFFTKLSHLETEDLILLLILYLMYRESKDEEMLMIIGLMLLL